MRLSFGCHFAGHTSPCVSVNWYAFNNLNNSSTLRPTGGSFIEICLIIPFGSIINVPRHVWPESVNNTPYDSDTLRFTSANSAIFNLPIPPFLRGVSHHAKCYNN